MNCVGQFNLVSFSHVSRLSFALRYLNERISFTCNPASVVFTDVTSLRTFITSTTYFDLFHVPVAMCNCLTSSCNFLVLAINTVFVT